MLHVYRHFCLSVPGTRFVEHGWNVRIIVAKLQDCEINSITGLLP